MKAVRRALREIAALELDLWSEDDAPLVAVDRIEPRMSTLDDWELLLALHHHADPWDGLITTDTSMLAQGPELATLIQTKLTLVVAVRRSLGAGRLSRPAGALATQAAAFDPNVTSGSYEWRSAVDNSSNRRRRKT